jgi:2-succinyl-5-enolpyruvyl-6-hydroxy-3-cyclohexene-1-carboxylate synthase
MVPPKLRGRVVTPSADTHLLLRAFVDELVRCGVADAVTSPGSRSTPLVLALVRDGRIRCHSQVDERAAGFFAVGAAKAARRPVVLACTSGTAAAEYLPAVIEAHEAGVPLIVLTADRPPELRDSGAGQTIDQVKLYGGAVRWFVDFGTHAATPDRLRWVRSLGCRVALAAEGRGGAGRPGPVHVNVPLREPLVLDGPLPDDPHPGRPEGAPWLAGPQPAPSSSAGTLAAIAADHERLLIVAGRTERDQHLAQAIVLFAAAAGAPVLGDPLSGARHGPNAVAHYDALLRDAAFAAAHRPDAVIRVGDIPTSKPLRAFLAGLDPAIPQVALAPEAVWHDPDATLHAVLNGAPGPSLAEAADALAAAAAAAAADAADAADARPWLAAWRAADTAAAGAIDATIGHDALNEPLVARTVAAALTPEESLFIAASMPIRDVETFAGARDEGPRMLSNRGANGIDGTVASALGVAATGAPTTLLIGDVALAYDHSALLGVRRLGLELRIVLVDNAGGGIFDFLSVATQTDVFDEHVATPPGLDPRILAELYGLEYAAASTADELRAQLRPAGSRLIHVRTDRAENVALHRRVWAAVSAALA